MDPELRRELDEIHALVKDNHKMLRAIRRGQWFSFLSTIIVWVVVLALPLLLYQNYIAPLIKSFSESSGTPAVGAELNVPSFADLQKLINSYTAGE
jgi:cytoskeletal protein RodZ